jgi:hypothetical protein
VIVTFEYQAEGADACANTGNARMAIADRALLSRAFMVDLVEW